MWEEQISLNSFKTFEAEPLKPVSAYTDQDIRIDINDVGGQDYVNSRIALDTYPLPATKDREGYHGERHFEYWLHGLRDYRLLTKLAEDQGVELSSILDIGCASGRVIRHFGAYNPGMETLGCDINALHVAWCLKYLPVIVFQSTSLPYFQIADSSVSMVSAFSVFSHIEAFETGWLMEIARILKPGGIAYLTTHTENTMKNMQPKWPIYRALERFSDFDREMAGNDLVGDKMIFRASGERSYSSNVFLRTDYIRAVWGRFLEVVDIVPRHEGFQEGVILRKPL